ncbi:MAG: dodecin family protein [Gammaproteobacteria bacterium]
MAKKTASDSSIARVTEVISTSDKSFEDAVSNGIKRASKTLRGIRGAWVKEMKVDVDDGNVTRYRVDMLVTFVVEE